MGCPAKKVCSKAAGSALLQDPDLVERILKAVVAAVDVPVTLKIRTGWSPENRNAVFIARIAENSGIQALTVHGRTRACGFSGMAEYRTILEVKNAVEIPIIANGDIDSPLKAAKVLEQTNADAIMIGRAALGRPWIFRAMLGNDLVDHTVPNPSNEELEGLILNHLEALYDLYGSFMGVRIARKHFHWYSNHIQSIATVRGRFNEATTPTEQQAILQTAFRTNPE
jgi:tRNA-dihydrouridine synthase B